MSDIDTIETYRRIADVLRSAQRVAIEAENAPEKRKRLRTFSAQEVALLLGVSSRELSAYTRSSHDRAGGPRSRLSFEEVLQLRRSLF
jgi:chromosome partitioning protein